MLFLQALGFLSWMNLVSPECAPVQISPVVCDLDLCKGLGYFTTIDNVGIAACSDKEIYIALRNETLVQVNSVHSMESVLQK